MKSKEKKKVLNKPEFITILAERCEISKREATEMYDAVFGTLVDVISEGNEVAIPNLGRVKIVKRAARVANNLHTGEKVEVPAKNAPKFQFSKNIKEAVAGL